MEVPFYTSQQATEPWAFAPRCSPNFEYVDEIFECLKCDHSNDTAIDPLRLLSSTFLFLSYSVTRWASKRSYFCRHVTCKQRFLRLMARKPICVEPTSSLVDEEVRIRVFELEPNQTVTLEARIRPANPQNMQIWRFWKKAQKNLEIGTSNLDVTAPVCLVFVS